MKARVKATGEIWEFSQTDEITFKSAINGHLYCAEELEFLEPSIFTPDYWTRLEHQYAGMAMQGLMSYTEQITPKEGRSFRDEIVDISANVAHALVEKMKKGQL